MLVTRTVIFAQEPGASLSFCATWIDPELPFFLLHIQGRTECHHLVLAPCALESSISCSANRDRHLFSSRFGGSYEVSSWRRWAELGYLGGAANGLSISLVYFLGPLHLCVTVFHSADLLWSQSLGPFPSSRLICLLNLKNVLNFSYMLFITLSRDRGVHPASAFLPIAGSWYHFIEEKLVLKIFHDYE